jgi:hypothetical protein
VENTPVAKAIARELIDQARHVGVAFFPRVVDTLQFQRAYSEFPDLEMVLLKLDDNPLLSYFIQMGLSRFEDQSPVLDRTVRAALNKVYTPSVQKARYDIMLELFAHDCRHFMLLQQPIFYITSGDWRLPISMHTPNGHIPLRRLSR